MANSLHRDLQKGDRVLLKKKGLSEDYHAEELRTVTVLDGFGMSKDTAGTALFVEWPDGEHSRVSGMNIQRMAR